jgi:hypothetical protein
MRYVNEYYAGLRKIPVKLYYTRHLTNDVKRMLYTEDAMDVIHAWILFTEAIEITEQVRNRPLYDSDGNLDVSRYEELQERIGIENEKDHELRVLVYGKKDSYISQGNPLSPMWYF